MCSTVWPYLFSAARRRDTAEQLVWLPACISQHPAARLLLLLLLPPIVLLELLGVAAARSRHSATFTCRQQTVIVSQSGHTKACQHNNTCIIHQHSKAMALAR